MRNATVKLLSVLLITAIAGAAAAPSLQNQPYRWWWYLRVFVINFPLDENGNIRVSMNSEPHSETLYLTAILNETGPSPGESCVLISNSSEVLVEGKNVTFIGGGVSGGASWRKGVYDAIGEQTYGYSAGGGVPGAGRVVVYDDSGNFLGQFALPLNVEVKFKNVGRIELYVEAPILAYLELPGYDGEYSAFIVASVYYRVE